MSRESRQAVRAVFLAAIMVISVFAAGIAFSGSAAASNHADLVVDDDFTSPDHDTNFSSIQNAVDNATEDDIIVVRSGTYNKSVSISTEGVSLSGVGDSPQLNGSVTIDADNVTVSDLNITAPESTSGVEARSVDGVEITSNTIHDVGTEIDATSDTETQAVYLQNSTGEVSDNDIDDVANDDSGTSKGIFVGDSDEVFDGSVTVTDNTISDVSVNSSDFDGGAGGAGSYGILVNGDVTDLNVSGNEIRDLTGLWVHGIGLEAPTPDATVASNTFVDLSATKGDTSDPDAFRDEAAIFFEANTGADTVTVEDNSFENVAYGVLPHPGQAGFSPIGEAVVVEGPIQTAVDHVAEGDTVSVQSGTYEESLTIDTANVTLVGPNAGTPGYEDRQSAEAVIEQGVVISADSVTLDGFEVTNNAGNGIKVANATSNVVITNNRVADITGGTAGDQKAFANGINLQFNDAFKKTSSGIEITNNEIHNITTEDLDSYSNDVIGIQLLPRGNDVEDLRIADNIISDIEAGDASSNGRAEARGISIDTQFIDEANGNTRGDFGQAENLTIEENELRNLTSEYSRAVTLFEDTGGSNSNPGTPIGPVNFTIRFNTIDNLTSEDPAGNVDARSTALFIGGYGNLGDEHQFVANNVEEGAVSRLLYGQVNPPESADPLNAGENWWGNEDGPRVSSSSGTVGRVATTPFLTVPYQQVDVGDDGSPRQFATELELTGGVNTIAFPAPSERTLNESLNTSNVENVLVYDNSEGSWTTAGNPTPDALDVYVVIVEEGETASLVMEFDNDFDADNTQLGTTEVSGGWNLVSPSQAADTADEAYATRNAEIGLTSENPFQSPRRQPFDADNAEFSPYRGYWTFVDEDDGLSTVGSSNFEGLTLFDYLENVNLPPEDD